MRKRRKFAGPIEAAASDQPDFPFLDTRGQAVAVVLDLMQPFGSVRRMVCDIGDAAASAAAVDAAAEALGGLDVVVNGNAKAKPWVSFRLCVRCRPLAFSASEPNQSREKVYC